MQRIDETNNEKVITGFRPNTSDKDPNTNKLIDKAIVADDKLKLETAGERWNSLARSGSSGCVPQRMAKVQKPPANKAKFTILNLCVPRCI